MFEIRTVSVPWKKNKVLRKFGERGGRWRYVSGRCGRKQQVHNSKPWLFSGANYLLQFSSVQSLGHVRLFATPWIAARQASLSITSSRNLLKLMPIELVTSSSHLILCRPLLLLPPVPPSIRVFSNESTLCMRWPLSTQLYFFLLIFWSRNNNLLSPIPSLRVG